jgi:hypothetical protein
VLAGAEGETFAAFVPTVTEISDPDRLLARLTLCRLALPRHATCALVLHTRHSEALPQIGAQHFDSVAYARDVRLELRRLVGRPRGERTRSMSVDTRLRAFERCHSVLASAEPLLHDWMTPRAVLQQVVLRRPPKTGGDLGLKTRSVPALTGGPHRARAYWYDDCLIQWADVRRSAPAVVAARIVNATRAAYSLDQGVPYLRSGSAGPTALLVADRLPLARWDPLKPLRAAAFAGMSVVVPRTNGDEQLREVVAFARGLRG